MRVCGGDCEDVRGWVGALVGTWSHLQVVHHDTPNNSLPVDDEKPPEREQTTTHNHKPPERE